MKKIIAMLLVLTTVLAFAGCTGNENPTTTAGAPEVNVMTHAEFMAATVDTECVVEFYVQATQGWWFDNEANHGKITIYGQTEEGGYFSYETVCTEEEAAQLTKGTKVRITGDKTIYDGEVEIMGGKLEILSGDTWVATAADMTALLGTEEIADHMNEFVSFKGMTVVACNDAGDAFMYKWNGSGAEGDDLYFNVSYNGATYTFCVESYLCGLGSDAYEAVRGLKVGDVIDLEGFLYWYNGAQPHITSVSKAG